MKNAEKSFYFIDTHAHCHLLRTYHQVDENGGKIIDDERDRFINDFKNQVGAICVRKVINIPITFTQSIDWPNNDLRSVFRGKRPAGPGVFRDRIRDIDGESVDGLTYFAQGLHPKFVHQLLYRDFIYLNTDSKKKSPSTCEDLVPPIELERREQIVKTGIENQLHNNTDIIAIGETGLEFYYDYDKRVYNHPAYQEKWFRYHLDLGLQYDLPVIIHLRSGYRREQNANKRAIEILKEYERLGKLRNNPGVIHCFIGNKAEAMEFHRLGFVLGIGAAFTYGKPSDKEASIAFNMRPEWQMKRLQRLYHVVQNIPLNWCVLETDSPYLPLKESCGYRQNTPLSIPAIAKQIVEAKNTSISGITSKSKHPVTLEEVAEITTKNALRVFPGLKNE